MNRKTTFVFVSLVFVILILPFVGMTFWPTTETTENTPLAEIPSRFTDGKPNIRYLSDWGDYFDDHFAFRQQFVTANAKLYGTVFHQSTTDQVIFGKNGWLYYSGTLKDYQGKTVLSDRAWFCLVHNLKLMQEYTESRGSRFLVTIAPNKNSLYRENMPERYFEGTPKNIDLISEKLNGAGVPYADLYSLFREQNEPLYFKKDSHWNNKGAVLAYRAICESLGKEDYETYENVECTEQYTHLGDLDEMLYPLAAKPEKDYIYARKEGFDCGTENYMDQWIETNHSGKTGRLLMYRDSFGESLLPFLAEEFEQAYFSRLVPYHLTQIEQYHPDYVVIERVERRLSSFVEEAPVMPAPERGNLSALQAEKQSKLKAEFQGSYLSVSGVIPSELVSDESEVYVAVRSSDGKTKTYQPFYLSGEQETIQLYLKKETVPEGTLSIQMITEVGNQYVIAGSAILNSH